MRKRENSVENIANISIISINLIITEYFLKNYFFLYIFFSERENIAHAILAFLIIRALRRMKHPDVNKQKPTISSCSSRMGQRFLFPV